MFADAVLHFKWFYAKRLHTSSYSTTYLKRITRKPALAGVSFSSRGSDSAGCAYRQTPLVPHQRKLPLQTIQMREYMLTRPEPWVSGAVDKATRNGVIPATCASPPTNKSPGYEKTVFRRTWYSCSPPCSYPFGRWSSAFCFSLAGTFCLL